MWIAYDKSMAVIKYCENLDQLVQARSYIELYYNKWEDYVSYSRLHDELMKMYSNMKWPSPRK